MLQWSTQDNVFDDAVNKVDIAQVNSLETAANALTYK